MKDYLETLRSKPEQVRRRIALGAAAGFTAVVAVGWMIALTTSGALSISSPESAAVEASFAEGFGRYDDLAGAAGAMYQNTQNGASISIVEEENSSTLDRSDANAPEATVIPF
ncbi:hypothetical protein K2Y00_01225 [Patescibacteria group bacterium]|nr:hypothetical protein [Patescibacteria group bacterium]